MLMWQQESTSHTADVLHRNKQQVKTNSFVSKLSQSVVCELIRVCNARCELWV